jgi:hypothetical protein
VGTLLVTRGGALIVSGPRAAAMTALGWVLSGALLESPPWTAARDLAREAREARGLAEALGRHSDRWGIDIGSRMQAAAIRGGFSVPESFREGERVTTFAWTEGSGVIAFHIGSSASARFSVRAFSTTKSEVGVWLDAEPQPRATVTAGPSWMERGADLGPLTGGGHILRLGIAAPSEQSRIAIDWIRIDSATTRPDPRLGEGPRDIGVFEASETRERRDRRIVLASGLDQAPVGAAPPGWRAETRGSQLRYAADSSSTLGEALALGHGWCAAALVLLGPGLAFGAGRSGAASAISVLGISGVTLVVNFLALRLLDVNPGPLSLALGAVISMAALALLGRRRGRRAEFFVGRGFIPASASALLLFTWSATRLTPPLEDQDAEVLSTAHALAHRLAPFAPTNRGTDYFFAHPPALHFAVAGAATLSGEMPLLSYTSAPVEQTRYDDSWRRFAIFLATPRTWIVRQVNVLLGALAAGLLWELARRSGASPLLSTALCLMWMTFPEVVVRGGYGGYFSIGSVAALLLVAPPERAVDAKAFLWAALVDQKAGAVAAAVSLTRPRSPAPLVAFTIGLGLFAVWGLAIAPSDFVADFLRRHLVDRALGWGSEVATHAYPSRLELWLEFAGNFGVLFTVLSFGATALGAVSGGQSGPAGPISLTVKRAALAWLLCALAFTWTDWRQTKHLAQFVALPVVCLAAFSATSRPCLRMVWFGVLVTLSSNLMTIARLVSDFGAIAPRPSW